MKTPVSTYRLQIRPGFTLADAADQVEYLADLGVDWLYLSPAAQGRGRVGARLRRGGPVPAGSCAGQ